MLVNGEPFFISAPNAKRFTMQVSAAMNSTALVPTNPVIHYVVLHIKSAYKTSPNCAWLLFFPFRCGIQLWLVKWWTTALHFNGTSKACSTGSVWVLPLCLAKYLPRTMIKHNVTKTTTATTPPIKAWSVPCWPRALGSEERSKERKSKCWLVRWESEGMRNSGKQSKE